MIHFDIALVCYIFSFLLLLLNFFFGSSVLQKLLIASVSIAVLLNAAQFFLQWRQFASINNLLLMTTLSMGVIYLIAGIRFGKPYLGLFILPCIMAVGFVLLFINDSGNSRMLESMWLYIHIPLSVIGMAFFLNAFASGIMYFLLEKQLKKKNFGFIFERFPSLYIINKINSASLHFGFAFYTAGLIAAIGWFRLRYDPAEPFADSFYTKIVIALFAWIVTTAINLVKLFRTTTARQTAFASVIGITTILLTYAAVTIFVLR